MDTTCSQDFHGFPKLSSLIIIVHLGYQDWLSPWTIDDVSDANRQILIHSVSCFTMKGDLHMVSSYSPWQFQRKRNPVFRLGSEMIRTCVAKKIHDQQLPFAEGERNRRSEWDHHNGPMDVHLIGTPWYPSSSSFRTSRISGDPLHLHWFYHH